MTQLGSRTDRRDVLSLAGRPEAAIVSDCSGRLPSEVICNDASSLRSSAVWRRGLLRRLHNNRRFRSSVSLAVLHPKQPSLYSAIFEAAWRKKAMLKARTSQLSIDSRMESTNNCLHWLKSSSVVRYAWS